MQQFNPFLEIRVISKVPLLLLVVGHGIVNEKYEKESECNYVLFVERPGLELINKF